jgi:hypothetical protein
MAVSARTKLRHRGLRADFSELVCSGEATRTCRPANFGVTEVCWSAVCTYYGSLGCVCGWLNLNIESLLFACFFSKAFPCISLRLLAKVRPSISVSRYVSIHF